jgi:hypothetical protein
MSPDVYPASRIKRRRSTKDEVERRRWLLYGIVADMRPMTVRQVFYQATIRGLVEKTESGYDKVQNDLTIMRKEDGLPYGWIVDHTRRRRKPYTCNSIAEALETITQYRRALWRDVEEHVEIWIEKEALVGVVEPITERYDVPLMPARGYASLSFLNEAAEYYDGTGKDIFVYHFGDYDPSGQDAARDVEEKLTEMSFSDIYFEQIAVLPQQIVEWNLPSRPTKASDSRTPRWRAAGRGESVELDAIEPGRLRQLVEDVINKHLPKEQLRVLLAAEESERTQLRGLIGMITRRIRHEHPAGGLMPARRAD